MAVLHGITASVLAVLFELLAGNAGLLLPFTVCVLYRVTLKFAPIQVFFAGFFAGVFFDMLYWRSIPGTAIVYGGSLVAVRLICDRGRQKKPLLSAAAAGILLGIFSIIPLAVLHRFYLGLPGISLSSAVAGVTAALILELLISPRNENKKETSAPPLKGAAGKRTVKRPRRRNAPEKKE